MQVRRSRCLNACAIFGLVLLIGVAHRPVRRYLQRHDVLNVSVRMAEVPPPPTTKSPTFADIFNDDGSWDSLPSPTPSPSSSTIPPASTTQSNKVVGSVPELMGGVFAQLGAKIERNGETLVTRDLVPDENEIKERSEKSIWAKSRTIIPRPGAKKNEKKRSSKQLQKTPKLVRTKTSSVQKRSQQNRAQNRRTKHNLQQPHVIRTSVRDGRRRLYYQYKSPTQYQTARYLPPPTCQCRQVLVQEGPCYEYIDESRHRCRRCKCPMVYECYDGASSTCKLIHQTSTVRHVQNGICKTMRMDAKLYVLQ